MRFKSVLVLSLILFTTSIFSQNIFVDSNQVALFFNGSSLWSEASQTLSLTGGIAVGGILDFSYQYSSTSIERQSYYDETEVDIHTVLFGIILTKKKMQVSVDMSLSVSNSTTILGLGFSLARKYQLDTNLEAVLSLSTGLALNLDKFPQKQEFAFALSGDLFIGKVVYFGPGIGYSASEFFYGVNLGIVLSFSGKPITH